MGDLVCQRPRLWLPSHIEKRARNVEAAEPGLFDQTVSEELFTRGFEGIDAEADMARRDEEPPCAHLVPDCFDIASELSKPGHGRRQVTLRRVDVVQVNRAAAEVVPKPRFGFDV